MSTQKACLESSRVYQAVTGENGEIKHYVRMTVNSFKEHYRNHKQHLQMRRNFLNIFGS
jgi:hypothetical protein